jgi:NitT/TauT family transport system permease protein
LDLDVVWAEALLAAITGSVLFFGIARLERSVTFWRPAFQSTTEKDIR